MVKDKNFAIAMAIFTTSFGAGMGTIWTHSFWGGALVIISFTALAYSIWERNWIGSMTMRSWIWITFIVLTWALLGYDVYDRYATSRIPANEHAIPVPMVKTIEQWPYVHLEQIIHRSFTNEQVLLDGRDYIQCDFKGVTLVFDGTAPSALTECSWDQTTRVKTSNPAIAEWSQILRAMGIIGPEKGVILEPLPPTPK